MLNHEHIRIGNRILPPIELDVTITSAHGMCYVFTDVLGELYTHVQKFEYPAICREPEGEYNMPIRYGCYS